MQDKLKHEAKTFGDWAYLAIAKHFNKTIKHESAVLEDKNPEELHQMRVGMRRLRSAIAGFSSAIKLPKNASDKRVGKVARILGQLRDIDVLDDIFKDRYRPILPDREQKQLDKALNILEKQRKRAFGRVEAILEDNFYCIFKKAFQDWLENPTYQDIANIAIDDILPDLLLPQVSQLLLHPGWLVGIDFVEGEIQFANGWQKDRVEQFLSDRGTILHELRKEAKRSRYNMELFEQFYRDNYQTYLKDIKQLQTVLGDIQDSSVLSKFLTDVFEGDFSHLMPIFAERLSDDRFQKWQEWEILQQQFLNPKTRRDLHATILSEFDNPPA